MQSIPPLSSAALRPAGADAVSTARALRPAGVDASVAAKPASASAAPERPSLLELLTPDERAFFEKHAALGPLTYRPGRASAPAPDAPLGQRIDVRG